MSYLTLDTSMKSQFISDLSSSSPRKRSKKKLALCRTIFILMIITPVRRRCGRCEELKIRQPEQTIGAKWRQGGPSSSSSSSTKRTTPEIEWKKVVPTDQWKIPALKRWRRQRNGVVHGDNGQVGILSTTGNGGDGSSSSSSRETRLTLSFC